MLKSRKIYLDLKCLRLWSLYRYSYSKSSSQNHYQTLGLSPNATMDDIKKAYKELCKKYHPDVSKEPNAVEMFKKINNAYTVLKDSTSKDKYDQEASYEKPSATKQQYSSQKTRGYNSSYQTSESYDETEKQKAYRSTVEEEQLYEDIFGKTYREDPMFYYRPENERLRKKYDEELEKIKNRKNANGNNKSKADDDTRTYQNYEDRKEWDDFMKDFARNRGGPKGSTAAPSVDHPNQESFLNATAIKWIVAGVALLGGMSFYFMWREKRRSESLFNAGEKPLTPSGLDNIREKYLKREEEKKEKKKADFLNSLALMKKYPRRNPNAISMLVDYTIWNDLKLYSVPFTYFHGEDEELCRFTDEFEKNKLYNIKMNTMMTLALESERVFKNVFVKVDDVLRSLKETGYYQPPGVFFRYFGYIYAKIRTKPIIVENLKEAIKNGDKVISVFDLFFRYSTPILMANNEYYEIPLKHSSYVKDTTTREGVGWLGNAHINHRPIQSVIANADERNVFIWKGPTKINQTHERYLRTWGVYYDKYEKL